MTSLLLLTALSFSPAQAGPLKITNVRNTYGLLGGTRADSKLMPGDALFVAYDIEGLTYGPDGRTQYRMAMEVVNKDGKAMFTQNPEDKVDYVPLGGTKLPRVFILKCLVGIRKGRKRKAGAKPEAVAQSADA